MKKNQPQKPKLPIMLDCETLALDSKAALIEVALVPFDRWEWPHKLAVIDPRSYRKEDGFAIDIKTVEFHQKQGTNILGKAETIGVSWRTAAEDIIQFFNQFRDYEIHLWCQGKDVDVPWLSNLLKSAGKTTPWHYRNTHCLRDLSQLYNTVPRAYHGDHTALKDCQAQIKHIEDIAKTDRRVAEWVWGPESIPTHCL